MNQTLSKRLTASILSLLMAIGLMLATQLPVSAGANWIRVSSGTTNGLNGVCYGNSKYVAVGDGGIILTSSNLSSWSKPSSGTTSDLLGVSTNGSGLFVAVGANGTVVYSSNNGVNWTATSVGGLTNTTGCITYGGGTFLAFFGGSCYTSTNGSSWTYKSALGSNVNGVSYGASKFWAVGNSVAASSADNGATWSNWSWMYCSSSPLNALAYNNATYFIAFGSSGMAYETFNSGEAYDKRTGFTSYNYKGAGYGFIDGSVFFVGVGANGSTGTGAIVTTETTASWNDKTVEYMPAGTPVLNAVCYGTTMFVAVGESGAILVSSGVSSPPVFTSGTAGSCSENTASTGYTAAATPSNGTSIAYSIAGGTDGSLFNIDSSTGVLTFNSPPNFESPGDWDGNNVYNVIIRATDSMMDADQSVAITVTNVNEAPAITSGASVSVPENQTSAYSATAVDPDSGTTLTWSITGGADAALFNIDSGTGAVTFKSAPNFESPGDSDHNNIYNITVKAIDNGGLWDAEDIAITVNDAADQPAVTTGGASSVSAAGAALSGTVNANGGDTTVYFQYGTSMDYGTDVQATTPSGGVVGGGSGNTSVGVSLTTLSPNTTYNFRVKAVNSEGTVYGDNATFTTTLPAPTASPGNGSTVDSGSSITLSDATAGTTIYYTTDNTDPTSSGTRQTGTSVNITGVPGATVTVKAYVILAGCTDSAVATFTYTVATYTAPTLNATGGSPTFYQGGSGVDLFSSVTAATNDSGQTFSGAVLSVSNVSDTTEYLTIGSTDAALTNGSSGAVTGIGNYSVSVAGGTATVTLSGMSLTNSDMQTLIDGISYKNTAATITTGSRVVTLQTITDSGSNNNSATVNITATVTVALQNATAPGTVVLAQGALNPVGGVANAAIPAAGGTDSTGKATGWINGTADTIKFTVTDSGSASSTISINGLPYTSGADYTIGSSSNLTIIVTTSESSRATVTRTFSITVEAAPGATAPGSVVLAKGTSNPVGAVTNVALPAAGGTDSTGKVSGWISGSFDTIKFTVTDSGSASSTITINGLPYTSGADYIISSASDLTIIVTTSESGKTPVTRTFTLPVELAGGAAAPSSIVLAKGTSNPVGGVTNVAIPAAAGTDSTGKVSGWISGSFDTIKFTVTDSGSASSTITINGLPYTSGADYIISSASDLTIIVTTSESGKIPVTRTFTVPVELAGGAAAPSSAVLAKGTSNPVGAITNVAIPAAGGTDSTGRVIDWISGTADAITFTITDSGSASSTITINSLPYTSGTDYIISSASNLTIIVTTTESGKIPVTRTFTVPVEAAGGAAVPSSAVLAQGTLNPVGGVTNVAIPAAGGTDTTGKVSGWTSGTADAITFTITDSGSASSTITINGLPYTSGTDYVISAASDLTIVVVTSESGKLTVTRTFTVTVSPPVIPTMSVGAQNGTLTAGTASSAAFAVNSTDIPDGTPVAPAWCNALGAPAATPTGLSTLATDIASNTSTITVTADASAAAGIYYLKAASGGASSGIVTVTINQPVTVGTNQTATITGPTTITVPSGVSGAKIDVDTAQPLPLIEINTGTALGTVEMEIPAGTTVSGPPGWDGTISMPTVRAQASTNIGGAQSVNAVVEVGFANEALTFSNAVRLLIPGMAGKSAGYVRNGVFTPITRTISADTQTAADSEIPAAGDGMVNSGIDLAIWTKHFTEFVAYTPSSSDEGSSPDLPVVQTKTATAIISDAATLNGNIASSSGYSIINYGFLWGTGSGSPVNKLEVGSNNQTGVFAADLGSLEAGTTYYFQAYATNSRGTSYGVVLSFTTASPNNDQGSTAAAFSDVPDAFWGMAAINSLSAQGVVAGYPDHTFRPDAAITRAEFSVILVKALKLNTSGASELFNDVAADAWYYDAVNTASENGLVSGTGDNRFTPNALITREQMAVMVSQSLGSKAPPIDGSELEIFKDKSAVSNWAQTGMKQAVRAGIIHGVTPDTLAPQADATRAQAAVMIYQLLNILK